MVKTPAEYQREYRQRLRDRERKATDATDAYLKQPFSDWMDESRWGDVTTFLEWMGINQIPDYLADADTDPDWREEDGPNRQSIGRAERMVGLFLDGASTLAGLINRYKIEEIDARLAEIEASDLSNPDTKKQALADAARLTKIRDELSKQVRWTLPQWRVKGE